MAKYRRRAHNPRSGSTTVTFRKGGRRTVKLRAVMTPAAKAARRARGKALAKKWGFFKKGGSIYQKQDGGTPKFIRRI